MKNLVILITLLTSFSAFATENCKDSNLNNVEGAIHYDEVKNNKDFTLLFEADSPAPAGFSEYFGTAPELCFDVMATYLKHNKSGKTYLMYTTHDDYCDGGNTTGIVIDMSLHSKQKLEESIVADIGDSEFYCR